MKQFEINGIKLEMEQVIIKKFLNKISYPIAIVDFETFRTFQKNNFSLQIKKAFFEKIFSVAFLIINKPKDLEIDNLTNKKLYLFYKTELPKQKELDNFDTLLNFQMIFFKFLIAKLLKYRVKSLIFLDSKIEVSLLKNYLVYFYDEKKYKDKINNFFHDDKIFDVYDLWNNDAVINLPQYKSNNKIGATKKTMILIKNNDKYCKFLKPESVISNNNIGRIIDQYFNNRLNLLDNFLSFVTDHNQNDVLTGAAILSLLYSYYKIK